jgi:hypothetical protein
MAKAPKKIGRPSKRTPEVDAEIVKRTSPSTPKTCGSRSVTSPGTAGAGRARRARSPPGLLIQSMEQHERVLCGRETQRSIKDSSKRVLDDEIDRLGLRSVFTSTETEIRGPNDGLFIFTGLKGNAAGVKSIEGVTTFWGDEAQAFSQGSSTPSFRPSAGRSRG